MDNLTILVHPGSCCGSANYNIGRFLADSSRDLLVDYLDKFCSIKKEGIIIFDGALSDELIDYPRLDAAIKNALVRAANSGSVAMRIFADDPDQVSETEKLCRSGIFKNKNISLIGAWYEPDENSGCVYSVLEVLNRYHYEADIIEDACFIMGNDF
jgi:hypothetical protein